MSDPSDPSVFLDEEDSIVMLRLSETAKDDDVLKLYKANMSEIQETSFLISCFPVMRKTLNVLKLLNEKKSDIKKLLVEI